MAKNKKEKKPNQKVDQAPDQIAKGDEFDDAVTTEISELLSRVFDDDRTADPKNLQVTDMQLTAHVECPVDDTLAPGFVLNDRFEMVELVHTGGMGHVYKAIDYRRHPDGSGEVHVAIKMMRASIASQEDAHLALEREAAKAQTLSHPNIINIFDFDEHDDQFFLVMEWLEGESVNALMRRTSGQGLTPSFAWPVIEGAAAGVQHAHENNVVHADINPSNIFVTDAQGIKLLDFGVARYTSSAEYSEGNRLAWVTQTYASPEVLSGQTPVFEDDVFSLGCVAYRLLSGNHPFDGSLSLVAKNKGLPVKPISSLADIDWQILRQALSYERSDRPTSASVFINRGASAAEADDSAARVTSRISSPLQSPLAAVVALVVLAGGWWLAQRGSDGEITPTIEASVPEAPAVTDTVDPPIISPAEVLVSAATKALTEGKLVSPDDGNARALYREALALEPHNEEARRGLRAISNEYVQQAHEALTSGDPVKAYAALAVAAETDTENSVIEIVNQLLAEKGNSELAEARLAASAGNFDLAADWLSRAERYTHFEPDAIQSIRRQIGQTRRDDEFLESLAAADGHMAAGRLTLPDGENAHALLLELYPAHGDDARLLASMERLGERLLTHAAFAATAARFAEATELLDAVDGLSVLAPEVKSARTSLEAAIAPPVTEEVPEPLAATEHASKSLSPVPESELVADEVRSTTSGKAMPDAVAAVVVEAADEAEVAMDASIDGAMADSALQPRRSTVQEFGIKKYVAPLFPRGARRRGLTGMVDIGFNINVDGRTDSIDVLHAEPGNVFAESAVNAVRQWRFEHRDDVMRARITLKFDLAP